MLAEYFAFWILIALGLFFVLVAILFVFISRQFAETVNKDSAEMLIKARSYVSERVSVTAFGMSKALNIELEEAQALIARLEAEGVLSILPRKEKLYRVHFGKPRMYRI